MSDSDTTTWEVYAPAGVFSQRRSDPRIVPLLRIARVANALSLGTQGMLHPMEDQSPAGHRTRWSSLLYTGALLHEGLQVAEGLAATLRSLPAYQDGFASIHADKAVQVLRRDFLNRLRNQGAFHVDSKLYRSALDLVVPGTEVIFSTGRGRRAGEIYFDLADQLVVEYLLGESYRSETGWQRLEGLLMGISDLSTRFMISAHRLIPSALGHMGWRIRERPSEPPAV